MGMPKLEVLEQLYNDHCKETWNYVAGELRQGWGKKDYIAALREHYLPPEGLPYTELNPMLCYQGYKLKKEELEAIWQDRNWIVQRKLNGVRAVVHFVKNVGVFVHSKTVSVQNWRFVDITAQFLFHEFIPIFDATLDGEIIVDKPIDSRKNTSRGVVTQSSLHSVTSLLHLEAKRSRAIQREQNAPLMFHAFDCTSSEGKDLSSRPLSDRLRALHYLTSHGILMLKDLGEYFKVPRTKDFDKEQFFKDILDHGGEGVILKHLNSPYNITGGRPKSGWIKMKRGLDFDAFVSGFKRGKPGTEWENMVGALEFSVLIDDEPVPIAYISGFDMQLREFATQYNADDDVVSLNPAVEMRVAAITGQDISSRELRISHAKIDRWRYEEYGGDYKPYWDCVTTRKELLAASKWVGK